MTLHVPSSETTSGMMTAEMISHMKKDAHLINNSRGDVVDIEALADAVKSGHLGGAAVDVFPEEPAGNGPGFESPLLNVPNVILTPHVGGSTIEAQVTTRLVVLLFLFCLYRFHFAFLTDDGTALLSNLVGEYW